MVPFLTGERVYLRSLTEADAETGEYPNWLNDAEVCSGNSHHRFGYSRPQALAHIRYLRDDRSSLVLAIALKDTDRHIGNISLQQIDPVSRSAEFAILVGAKDCWGKGLSFEAARLIVAHGFSELNLHRIYLGTFEHNTAMRAVARKLGMTEEGRRREAVWKRGSWIDVVEYGLLAHEYDLGAM